MYAVVDIGGRQVRVSPDQVVHVPTVAAQVGSTVTFDRVIAIQIDGGLRVGAPVVEGARVTGTVMSHGKEDKVMIGKYKKRKFYRRKKGHRQPFTEVKISEIIA